MPKTIPGLHHVTAIAGDPQKNVDFYVGTLGLRLVKRTVNFDDPGSYHLYFGNERGEPGTIMTFFPWTDLAPKGRLGNGQTTATAFSVPAASLDFWRERLLERGVDVRDLGARFGDRVLGFADPDGLPIELVFTERTDPRRPWPQVVPEAHAIRGFHGVTLSEEGYERTSHMLTDQLGFRKGAEEGNRYRFAAGAGEAGSFVDVVCSPEKPRGHVARGTVHHIAWRTPDMREQAEWQRELAGAGYNVTPIIDRNYFHSIYFREPGGVLFEIATDPPGFTADERVEELGLRLMLPPQYEPHRRELERHLPPIRLPTLARSA